MTGARRIARDKEQKRAQYARAAKVASALRAQLHGVSTGVGIPALINVLRTCVGVVHDDPIERDAQIISSYLYGHTAENLERVVARARELAERSAARGPLTEDEPS